MEFIKILFNIAFTVLPLLLLLLLQIPAAKTETRSENKFQNAETTTVTATTTTTIATKQNSQSATITATPTTTTTTAIPLTYNNKNKNNTTTRELRKHEQIIDNSIDFTVDPCDDFYQYACGEWKHQLYKNDNVATIDANDDEDTSGDNDDDDDHHHLDEGADLKANDDNNEDDGDKYDRTLAMIDYLADKEVLKYFNKRNITKNLNITNTRSQTTTPTTKEPDFIIKVYKYYKSCIAIQQYEPIKYLEWLELNEHVKWPSLINTTTNNEEHDANKHDHHQQHQQQQKYNNANTAAVTEGLEEDEIIINEDDDEQEERENNDHEHDFTKNNKQPSEDFENTSWITTLAILRKYGLNGIFIEEIIYNTKTFPSKLLLGFNKPIQQGGFKSLKNEHLKTVLQHLNQQLTPDSYKQLWLKITKFEWQLTKLNDVSDELGTTLISLEHLPVPWLRHYLKIIFNQATPLDTNMRIVVSNVAYFMALDELLNEYDDQFLNQYLQIRFLWHLYQQEPQQFQPFGCILHIKRFIPLAFEWIYEQENSHLIQEIPKIHEMYNNLRRQFNITLYNNKNNFDSSALEKFVTKLEAIQLKVGSFVDIDRAEFFYENRKFYQQLKLSSREFYFNHLKMLKFNFDALHFGLRTITTHSPFYDMQEYHHGLSSSPYYNQRLNTLHIPLSLLQPPVYHSEYPDIYKYSTLGFILAQTLMYGFNLNGLATDEHLKLLHHVKCLRFMDPLEINDKIADVSGFRLAYHTFFHNTQAHNLISNRKIFFLNFAQSFCATHTADDDLGRSHVNYALAQFAEFAKTFECSPDSHMNPHEKCYLWD